MNIMKEAILIVEIGETMDYLNHYLGNQLPPFIEASSPTLVRYLDKVFKKKDSKGRPVIAFYQLLHAICESDSIREISIPVEGNEGQMAEAVKMVADSKKIVEGIGGLAYTSITNERQIYGLLKVGLPHIKIGGRYYFWTNSVTAWYLRYKDKNLPSQLDSGVYIFRPFL
ncbi:MAG TPA: hypothetical protein EYP21_07375 [Syntrophaceae bacterium]|nr:hypothetical protein [Syntrophaceae bacterium]